MSRGRKIRDIDPPKKFDEDFGTQMVRHVSAGKSFLPGSWVLFAITILVLAGIGLASLHFLFAKATVIVRPVLRSVEVYKRITAGGSSATSISVFEETVIATKLFFATGKELKDIRAKGVIRVFNNQDRAITLVAQTRFMSEEGKVFRAVDRVIVPGGTRKNPGIKDVDIVAAEPGKDYNIGPSQFSIPGLAGSALYTQMHGESTNATTGGVTEEITVVSSADIAQAERTLVQELGDRARVALDTKIPDTLFVIENATVVSVLEAGTIVKEGAALDEFSYRAQVQVTVYAVPQAELESLQSAFLAKELQDKEQLAQGTTKVTYEQVRVDEGVVSFDISIRAGAYQEINPTELVIRLRGKSQEQAQLILFTYPGLQGGEILLWPFWRTSLPEDVEKIDISLRIDDF